MRFTNFMEQECRKALLAADWRYCQQPTNATTQNECSNTLLGTECFAAGRALVRPLRAPQPGLREPSCRPPPPARRLADRLRPPEASPFVKGARRAARPGGAARRGHEHRTAAAHSRHLRPRRPRRRRMGADGGAAAQVDEGGRKGVEERVERSPARRLQVGDLGEKVLSTSPSRHLAGRASPARRRPRPPPRAAPSRATGVKSRDRTCREPRRRSLNS